MIEAFSMPWSVILAMAAAVGGYVLALVLIPRILLDRREPQATFAWLLIIIFLPYLGAAAYYILRVPRVKKKTKRKRLTENSRTGHKP